MAVHPTPDRKVGSSSLSVLITFYFYLFEVKALILSFKEDRLII